MGSGLPEPEHRLLSGCRICGSQNIRQLCETPTHRVTEGRVKHFLCRDCGSAFIGTRVSDEELAAAYGSRDRTQYYKETLRQAELKIGLVVRALQDRGLSDRAVLDIGTGNALLPRRLIEAGFADVRAHEVPGPDVPVPEGMTVLYRDFDGSSIPSSSVDAVTLIDVLEHVAIPRNMLALAGRILKPSGILYLHTPVVGRLDKAFHRLHFVPILRRLAMGWQRSRTSVYHLSNFSGKALEKMLDELGFRVDESRMINELSWPVTRYVRVYITDPLRISAKAAPLLAFFLAPLLRSPFLNSNKAIIAAIRLPDPPSKPPA